MSRYEADQCTSPADNKFTSFRDIKGAEYFSLIDLFIISVVGLRKQIQTATHGIDRVQYMFCCMYALWNSIYVFEIPK